MKSFDAVPASIDVVLDGAWLSRALGRRHAGCRVASVAVRGTRSTVASKHFIEVGYTDPGDPPAPAHLCVKGYFEDAERRAPAGRSEARFYRDWAPTISTRVPDCSYVGMDEQTGASVLILEDLRASGATPLDALHHFTPDLSAATLSQLADLHAQTWRHPELDQPWLAPRMASLSQSTTPERLQALLDLPRGDGLSSAVRNGTRVRAAMAALSRLPHNGPPCMLHGDTHAGNVFATAAGPGLLDWQLVQRGTWATDVAYHIGAVLETEERRRCEWDLLRCYLDRLGGLGIEVPPWEAAVTAYRQQLAYGYYLWSMTQYTPEELTTATIRRLGHAVEDHETFDLLGV